MLFPWKKRRKASDEKLGDVADQAGLRRSLVGIGAAVILGLLFQAAFSGDTISGQIRRAAERVHEKLWIEFDAADLSLADGPFPEFAIVVSNVRLASDEACWLSPIAEVDRLRLPLDLGALLRGKVEISEVILGQVNLQLRTDASRCREKTAVTTPPLSGAASAPAAPAPKPLFAAPETRGPISRVFVHSLQVQYLPIPFTGFEVDRLDVRRKSESPLQVTVGGELNLGGATLSGDYSSRARFDVDYAHPRVKLSANGTWREGSYQLNADADVDTKLVGLSGSIDHLPLSQIIPVLKKYELLKGEYDGRQVWLNLKLKTPEPKTWNAGVPVDVEAFSFEGDLGRIEARAFHIMKWSPLEFSNTEIFFRGLQVEKLLRLFGRGEKPRSLGSLGELNGLVKLDGPRKFMLSGEYSGLEFIFANRGERRTQAISLMTGVLGFDEGKWDLKIDKLRPHDGLFLGEITAHGDDDTGDSNVHVRVEEMHLRPEVQELMSGGGSLGRWAGEMNLRSHRGEVREVNGQVLGQEILVDGVDVGRVRAQLSSDRRGEQGPRIVTEVKAQDIKVAPGSPARKLIDPLVAGLTEDKAPAWEFPQVSVKAELHEVNDAWSRFEWLLRPVTYGAIQLQSEGGWDSRGNLTGQVDASARGRRLRWKVEGPRDAPIFSQDLTKAPAGGK